LIRGSRATSRVIFGYSPQQTLRREPVDQRPAVSGGQCGRDVEPTLVSITNISPAPASWSLRSDPPAPYSAVAPYCAAVSSRLPPRLYQQSSRAETFSALSWVNGVLAGAGPTLAVPRRRIGRFAKGVMSVASHNDQRGSREMVGSRAAEATQLVLRIAVEICQCMLGESVTLLRKWTAICLSGPLVGRAGRGRLLGLHLHQARKRTDGVRAVWR
jgi:hypothetical protein